MFNQIFNFEKHEVRISMKDGSPWFVAKDVCDILEVTQHRRAIMGLDDDERGLLLVHSLGGNQEMNCVNESGLYHLIFNSRKKVAKEFRKWVTSEVLPSIRKHGVYIPANVTEEQLQHILETYAPDMPKGTISELNSRTRQDLVKAYYRSKPRKPEEVKRATQQVFDFINNN